MFCVSLFFLLFTIMNACSLFDFNTQTKSDSWQIVDDGVMGGLSKGDFQISKDGHGIFSGFISTANNGGFSSVRHLMQPKQLKHTGKLVIKLKGDGKRYQVRIKDKASHNFSYAATFQTSGQWEEVEILLEHMQPIFRGQNVNQPNFSGNSIEEVRFLIANKKSESFKLLIDKISIRSLSK